MKNIEIKIDEKPPTSFALSENATKEFQQICFEEYGLKISKEEARIQGYNLLRVFELSSRSKEVSHG